MAQDAVMGANAVVRRNVPAGAVAGGVPARTIAAPLQAGHRDRDRA